MNSFMSMNWCNTAGLSSKLSGKPSGQSRASPVVEIPGASKLKSKRKRTMSPEPVPASSTDWKKPRSVTDASQRLPLDVSLLPVKTDSEQSDPASLAYATPGATPTTATNRPECLDTKMDMDVDRPEASPTRNSSALPPSNTSRGDEQKQEREDEAMADAPREDAEMKESKLQQWAGNVYNMQILLKHDELRLIETELAKCQVALEQLRRCELRAYPGSEGLSADVSAGKGAAVMPPAGYTKPSHAAPHGVTDGPYTRHYRQWLLPDPQFDSQPIYAPSAGELAAQAANRPTRNSGSARKSTSKSINVPHVADHSASMPSQPPVVAKKEKSGPLILRRIADGKLVKLVCNDCQRGDMNSIQGFLNHCRIAHKVEYKSHEAAAVDCGRLMDEQEIATLPAESQATPAPKPTTRHTPARAPATVTSHVPTNASVHPYNTPGASIPKSAQPKKQKLAAAPSPAQPAPVASSSAQSFTPSSQAPRLSAFFAKNNVGGDLDQAITAAKQKVDIGIDDEEAPSPGNSSPSTPFAPKSKATADSSRGVLGVARPSSRKGYRQPTQQRPRPSPLATAPAPQTLETEQQGAEVPESPQDSHHAGSSLSPHTADSEPGLISDMDDDEDHGSASEEEGTAMLPASRGPVLPVSRSCADANVDAMDVDVAVDDEIDEQGVVIRRNSMLGAHEDRPLRSTGSPSRNGGGKRPVG